MAATSSQAPVLVVQHGGPSKQKALAAAHRLGDVLVVDAGPSEPGAIPSLRVPALTAADILRELDRLGIQPRACVTYVDPAVVIAAETAEHLGLPGIGASAARQLKNKLDMRGRLASVGVLGPRYAEIDDPSRVQRVVESVGCPAVIKPVSGAYSLGVVRVDNPADAADGLRRAATELKRSAFGRNFHRATPQQWMVEELLVGPEVSVEILGRKDDPRVLAVHEKVIDESGGHFREDRFVTSPWKLSPEMIAQIEREARRVALALSFTCGVGHLEMRLTERGVVTLELQACPGGGLIPAMVERTHATNLHELHARAHVHGFSWEAPQPRRRSCAMDVLYAPRPGPFRIDGCDRARSRPGVVSVDVWSETGKAVEPYAEFLGFVCCEAEHAVAAVERLDAARREIVVSIAEGPTDAIRHAVR